MRGFFLILFLFFFRRPALGQGLSSAADLAALYRLRASLGLRARDWPRGADPCSAWAGVGCIAGRVVSLNVSGLRRTRLGRMDPKFAVDGLQNLTRLAAFNATVFPLPGPIPDWFGTRLPSLSVLVLRQSSVAGPIPASLGSAAGIAVLDLSGNLLSGPVPPALGTLPNLKTLILSNNSLTGSVPPQLGDLSSLVTLDLSRNFLTGHLPDDLKNLRSLQKLNLRNNSLTGSLPGSLFSAHLSLLSIELSHNNFSGALPDSLWSLPELEFLDVSYNNLTGTTPDLVLATTNINAINLSNNLYYGLIPSGFRNLIAMFSSVDLSENYFQGTLPGDNRIRNASFASNCFHNASNQRSSADCEEFYRQRGLSYDNPAAPTAPTLPNSSHNKSGWSLKYILIGVFSGIAFLGILILVLVLCLMRRRADAARQRESSGADAARQRESSADVIPSGTGAPTTSATSVNLSAVGDSFTYEQLLRATTNFNDANLIRHGHSGDLYRGVLEDGIPVVVKRIDVHVVKREAYVVELDLFAKVSHERLVPFLGHCLENENEKLLVYRYMPNGDLCNALYREPRQEEEGLQSLDWITRLKIATGVAEALSFLHHECTTPLVHRDVQASSILLDDKFEVRLGSLSEVRTQVGNGHQNVITRFLRLSTQTSEQSVNGSPPAICAYDVYCLGKVLLELVTGKLGISASNDAPTIEWMERTLPYISTYEKELVTKIVDPSLIVDEDLLEEVWAMAIVAKSCLNPKPSKRPLVRYVLKALENPLKVVREENGSGNGSDRLKATSSRGSWRVGVFGSWRRSSSENIVAGPPRDDRTLKRSGTLMSQGSGGEHSFSHRRQSKEIFPEPSGEGDIED